MLLLQHHSEAVAALCHSDEEFLPSEGLGAVGMSGTSIDLVSLVWNEHCLATGPDTKQVLGQKGVSLLL